MKNFSVTYLIINSILLFCLLGVTAAMTALGGLLEPGWVSFCVNAAAVGFFVWRHEVDDSDQLIKYGPIFLALFNLGILGWFLAVVIQLGLGCQGPPPEIFTEFFEFICGVLMPMCAADCAIHGILAFYSVTAAIRFFKGDGGNGGSSTDGKVV